MASGFDIIRCRCGHLNAGQFNCAKCGGQISSSFTYKPGKNPAAQPVTSSRPEGKGSGKNTGRASAFQVVAQVFAFVIALGLVSFVGSTWKNVGSQRTPSAPTATTAERMSEIVRENQRIEGLIPTPPTYQEAFIVPPVQSVDFVGPSTLAKDRSPKRSGRDLAKERVAPQTESKVVNQLPQDGQGKAVVVPRTGDLQPRRRSNAIAPFNIQTRSGANYLVKLVNVTDSKDQIWIFLRGGEPYSTKVAVGNYALRVASGSTWYGREDLFGPDTRFFRLRGKRGAAVDESPVLEFKKERNRIVGKSLNFEGSVDGNMEQEAMSRAQFDAN
jgi:hypothetical protein